MALRPNQHNWQAEVGALGAIGLSGQMAPKSTDMTLSESGKEWLAAGKL
jgi:hypothetical protein